VVFVAAWMEASMHGDGLLSVGLKSKGGLPCLRVLGGQRGSPGRDELTACL
jgi:hypothetical protein